MNLQFSVFNCYIQWLFDSFDNKGIAGSKILSRYKMTFQFLHKRCIHIIIRFSKHIFEHRCQFLNILFLLLHISIIRYILRELLALLWCQIQLLRPQNTLLYCLITGRKIFDLLGNGPVQVFRFLFNDQRIIFILLEFHQILYISA